jgi:hypothetical protein
MPWGKLEIGHLRLGKEKTKVVACGGCLKHGRKCRGEEGDKLERERDGVIVI